ncbi:MAG: response regulator [Deltaproteobacteria bacterium]|nr:response regulator [Deltaproteobacteria bacterium]
MSDTRATVLVVEDEEVVRRILAALLTDLGHQVLEAGDGEAAVQLMDSHTPDLVITDKNLPGISGLDVLRAARERHPHAALMVVTGYASYESVVEALRLGACEYMEKPFLDLKAIQDRVRAALAARAWRHPTAEVLVDRLVEALSRREDGPARAALPHAQAARDALHPPGD